MTSVYPEAGGLEERVVGGPSRWIGAKSQANAPATLLEGYVKGTAAPTIRALGEKGALANQDVERALNLFPKLMDSATVAWGKAEQLNDLFVQIQKAIVSGTYDVKKGLGGVGLSLKRTKSKKSKYQDMNDEELLKALGK